MKQAILLIILFIATLTSFAQHNNNNTDRYRQYAGRYGGNSGICLFEDGGFMLYGYATAVFGHYNFEKDYLLFFPDKPELLEVYAHYNKDLIDSTRIYFAGFEEGKTFVQFNKEKPRRVFNDDANCFDAPFVYQAAQKLTGFTLSFIRENVWWDLGKPNPSWEYQGTNKYNDFVYLFNEPKQEYENFDARLVTAPGKTVLQLSNYGGDNGFIKQTPDQEEQRQWQEILEWKKQHDELERAGTAVIFANRHYSIFPKPDSLNYTWDGATNQYISRQATENEDYFRSNPYQDDRFLRKYIKLMPANKDTISVIENSGDSSIFYTVCGEGVRPSYHYNGFPEYSSSQNDSTPLIQTLPAPPLEVSPNKIDDSNHMPDSITNSNKEQPVDLLKPFAVNRPDGFYAVENKNAEDVTQTILALIPSLIKKDMEVVQYKISDRDESVITIRFTKTGTGKLKKFTSSQVGKQIALVVNGKVMVMPYVAESITNGRIDINWGYSSAEAEDIAQRLQNK